jgi:hypothetical protein
VEGYPTKQELVSRLANREDNFTERKLEGVKDREIRKTIVAFANSVPEGRTAVLYLGIGDKGDIIGVSNTDTLQKRVRKICETCCYPPIKAIPEVIETGGKFLLAVVITAGDNRPYFSGLAYIRKGSESVAASEELFDEMITNRLAKPHEILRWKEKIVTLLVKNKITLSSKKVPFNYNVNYECRIEECTPNRIRLYDIASGRTISYPLERLSISYDEKKYRLMLIV